MIASVASWRVFALVDVDVVGRGSMRMQRLCGSPATPPGPPGSAASSSAPSPPGSAASRRVARARHLAVPQTGAITLAERLSVLRDDVVGEVERPQSRVTDFYRELGHLFGFPVSTSNRWGAHKAVRAKWQEHIHQTLFRPILLIDEAQEMSAPLLAELCLLGSTKLDTCTIITVVLCGDRRIEEHLRTPDLAPINSRIRARLVLEAETPETLGTMLCHLLTTSGNPALMTDELQRTLCEHAAGNRRVLMNLCNEMLALAVAKNAKRLDEELYLEITSAEHRPARAKPVAQPPRTKPSTRR